jgi:hypothetical protein
VVFFLDRLLPRQRSRSCRITAMPALIVVPLSRVTDTYIMREPSTV